jgi:HSP20 family protein
MANITRWEPFREMRRMHDMLDRMMEDTLFTPNRWENALEGLAPVDMWQTEDEVIVKATLPGIKAEDIDISISGDTLTIRGETRQDHSVEDSASHGGRRYIMREHRFSRYARTLTLPVMVQSDKAEANFEDGVLTLTLPKAEEVKPKTISVKAK